MAKAKNEFWEKYRDPRWQAKRLRIMERAGFKCEMCGDKEKTLNIHHGYYTRDTDPWDYWDDTLWCLCDLCHEQAGSIKHDCHIELARINPVVMGIAFRMIYELRDKLHHAHFDSFDVSELGRDVRAIGVPNGIWLAKSPEMSRANNGTD